VGCTKRTVYLSSVKRHVEHIIEKLKVADRTQAAVKAIELGCFPHRTRKTHFRLYGPPEKPVDRQILVT